MESFVNEFFDKDRTKEETVIEENKETVEVVEPPESTESTKPSEKIEEPKDDWKVVKERFKTPEEFQSYVDGISKKEEYFSKLESELAEVQDPMKYFSSVESAKREQLLMKRGDIDYSVADSIVRADLKSMSPEKILALDLQIGVSGITAKEAEAYIKEKYGIEDGEEVSGSAKIKMSVESKEAIKRIEELRNDLHEPEAKNYKEIIEGKLAEQNKLAEERYENWNNAYDQVTERTKEFKLTEKGEDGKDAILFSYKVDDEFLKNSREELAKAMVRNGIDPSSEEAIRFAEMEFRVAYLAQNWEKMLKAAYVQGRSAAVDSQQKSDAGMTVKDKSDSNVQTKTNPTTESFKRFYGF